MKRLIPPFLLLAALAAVPAAIGLPAIADSDHHEERDHDEARAALRRGDVLPLIRILEIVGDKLGGRVIEVEFERRHEGYVYELEVLGEGGRLREVKVDAATGRILSRGGEDD
ncbi:PepSY domain-containing protein [Rhodobium gokarnense]|uniref:Membrane protein YkoI n=1 Tax=Rhodobium gokarnense TaxID=364296 RepID=A0ABT3HFA2_9HYPH|nr:PepSY domain-containing protein [Rhodobium gokarnense]MCW2309069.1 putative membrane protein YkoI [Rhodobium gokarnense]